jgi:hypothetical protein
MIKKREGKKIQFSFSNEETKKWFTRAMGLSVSRTQLNFCSGFCMTGPRWRTNLNPGRSAHLLNWFVL